MIRSFSRLNSCWNVHVNFDGSGTNQGLFVFCSRQRTIGDRVSLDLDRALIALEHWSLLLAAVIFLEFLASVPADFKPCASLSLSGAFFIC